MPKNRNAQSQMRNAEDTVNDYANEAKDMFRETSKQFRDYANKARNKADDYAHERPWQVIGAAALAGFLIGAMIFRPRD